MTFSRNLLVNTGSQLLIGLIGILTVPLLVRLLGLESYGLVAFFVTLQAWVALLDLGLGQALSRQTARIRVGALEPQDYQSLLSSIRVVFMVGAVMSATTIWLASDWISTSWLKVGSLDPAGVASAVAMMGVAVALRWWSGMYRGVVIGHERFLWLGGFNVAMALLRYGVVFPVLLAIPSGATATIYFGYQVVVAVVELTLVAAKSRALNRALPASPSHFNWPVVKAELAFAMSLTFASLVWILVTQSDRLTLSKVLTLEDYAVFSLAATLATAITMIYAPATAVILPRLTRLVASASTAEVHREYIRSTKIVALVVFPVAGALAFAAYPFLLIWTGDQALSEAAAPIAALYILGNGVVAVAVFAYYLQYALGNLRLHVIASLVMLILLVPAQIVMASAYGGVGAGIAWLGLNLLYVAVWMPVVHHQLAPGIHRVWLVESVIIPAMTVAAALSLALWCEQATGPWSPVVTVLAASGFAACGGLAAAWIVLRSKERRLSDDNAPSSDARSRQSEAKHA